MVSYVSLVSLMFSQGLSGSDDEYIDGVGGQKLSKPSQRVEDGVEESTARVVRVCACWRLFCN